MPLKVLFIFNTVHFFAYFLEFVRDLILEFLLGEHKKGRYEESNLGEQATILLTTHSRKVVLDICVLRKQAKSLKNTSDGVSP